MSSSPTTMPTTSTASTTSDRSLKIAAIRCRSVAGPSSSIASRRASAICSKAMRSTRRFAARKRSQATGTYERTRVRFVDQPHGRITSLGMRFDEGDRSLVYAIDYVELTDAMASLYQGADIWVSDCLRRRPHPTHAHLDAVLGWARELKVGHLVLSHLDNSMDHAPTSVRIARLGRNRPSTGLNWSFDFKRHGRRPAPQCTHPAGHAGVHRHQPDRTRIERRQGGANGLRVARHLRRRLRTVRLSRRILVHRRSTEKRGARRSAGGGQRQHAAHRQARRRPFLGRRQGQRQGGALPDRQRRHDDDHLRQPGAGGRARARDAWRCRQHRQRHRLHATRNRRAGRDRPDSPRRQVGQHQPCRQRQRPRHGLPLQPVVSGAFRAIPSSCSPEPW